MQHSPPAPQPQQPLRHHFNPNHQQQSAQSMLNSNLVQHLHSSLQPNHVSLSQSTFDASSFNRSPQPNPSCPVQSQPISSPHFGQSSTFNQFQPFDTTSTILCPDMAPLTPSQVFSHEIHVRTPIEQTSTQSSDTRYKFSRPNDWKYAMRREMQEIVPGLYLGPFAAASPKNLDKLNAAQITHIVCVRHESERHLIKPRLSNHFEYWEVDLHENPVEPLINLFETFYSYVSQRLQRRQSVLVHSNTGMCRSAALVIAFVMRRDGLDVQSAIRFVQQKRFCICTNEFFLRQLTAYEPIAKAHFYPHSRPQSDSSSGSLKRSLSETDLNA